MQDERLIDGGPLRIGDPHGDGVIPELRWGRSPIQPRTVGGARWRHQGHPGGPLDQGKGEVGVVRIGGGNVVAPGHVRNGIRWRNRARWKGGREVACGDQHGIRATVHRAVVHDQLDLIAAVQVDVQSRASRVEVGQDGTAARRTAQKVPPITKRITV